MERRDERNANLNNRNNYYVGDNLARTLEDPSRHRKLKARRERLARLKAQKAAERKEKVIRRILIIIRILLIF